MKKRGLVSMFLLLFAVSGVAVGCGSDDNSSESDTQAAESGLGKKVTADELQLDVSKASQDYNIAFTLGAAEGTFFAALKEGGQAAADELGVQLNVQGPPEYDAAQQATVIDTLLAQQPDGMVVEPVDAEASIPPLQNVNDQGIPMVTMDTVIGDGNYGGGGPAGFPLAYVGSDNQEAGRVACEELGNRLDGAGEVFIQADLPGDSSLNARTAGCKAALAEFPGITIVDTQFGDEDAAKSQAQAEAVLQKYPDLAGIFSNAGLPTEGTAAALKNANKADQVQLVGFDATQANIDALKQGLVDAVIAQKPRLMGDLGVKMVVAALEGQQDLPTFVDTGTDVVTQDNLSQFDLNELIY